jgi:hypothetical protein
MIANYAAFRKDGGCDSRIHTRCDQMETVGAMEEETNVAGKMALRTGRNVLQFDT